MTHAPAPPTPPCDPEATLAWLRGSVDAELTATLTKGRAFFTARIGPEIDEALSIGQSLAQGGKRLRAAFAYLGWMGYAGATDPAPAVGAGVGLEFFHLAALVHDDVIDASQVRRGVPAAHRQFTQRHHGVDMIGDAETFGTAGAILLGDLFVVLANDHLGRAGADLPAPAGSRARDIVTEMMSEVTLGQYLDIYAQSVPWSADPAEDLDRAHRVLRSKSARYSVEHPMLLGAAMAGATDADMATVSAIGLPIGEAFQLRDDLLGVFGDPAVTGKPSGDDLREGKRTVLVTTALAGAEPAQADRIRTVLGSAMTDDDVADVRSILTSSGAVAEVEDLISRRADEAGAAIEDSGWPAPARALAAHLARAAIRRNT